MALTRANQLNKGIAEIVRAVANAVRIKGVNCVHATDEMCVTEDDPRYPNALVRTQAGKVTFNARSNFSHARAHGLIAQVEGSPGCYCLTTKGTRFLRNEPIEQVAIIDMRDSHTAGYLADQTGETIKTTISKVYGEDRGFWDGFDYEIVDGKFVHVNNPNYGN